MFWQGGAKKRLKQMYASRLDPVHEQVNIEDIRIGRTDAELLRIYYNRNHYPHQPPPSESKNHSGLEKRPGNWHILSKHRQESLRGCEHSIKQSVHVLMTSGSSGLAEQQEEKIEDKTQVENWHSRETRVEGVKGEKNKLVYSNLIVGTLTPTSRNETEWSQMGKGSTQQGE